MKHPKWRVPSWGDVDPAARNALTLDVEGIVAFMPFSRVVADIEIVGSYAFGCADMSSDIDINIAADSWQHQCDIIWKLRATDLRGDFAAWLIGLEDRHRIRVDIGYRNPDSKKYVPVFSTRENKLYNAHLIRPEGMHVEWDYFGDTGWLIVPRRPRTYSFAENYSPDEIKEWADRYGDKFQWQ